MSRIRHDQLAEGVEALPEGDRATAMYAGLRLGELRGLTWEDVDLEAGVIRVERSWDPRAGMIETKSRAGRRKVPIAQVLRRYLVAERLRRGRVEGPVFRSAGDRPIWTSSFAARAKRAWETAGLEPIRLHECRHTFASLMIAAEVNAKALSTCMGHASITITLDRYGHLMPGNEAQAGAALDAYLADPERELLNSASGSR